MVNVLLLAIVEGCEKGGKSTRWHAKGTSKEVLSFKSPEPWRIGPFELDPMRHRLKLICAILGLAACASPDQRADEDRTLVTVRTQAPTGAQALYEMPTPNELFRIVREMSGEGQKRMMSPVINQVRYNTTSKRALNFGVYATDLVYASSFRLTSEVARYYLTCKDLGDELGLTGSFNDGDFARLERNLTQGDSLDVISNAAYEEAYRRLQEDDMGSVLALVLAGGWVESMHLVTGQVIHFDPQDPLVLRVAEQKAGLDHLVDLMEPYVKDPAVNETRDRLVGIRDIFDTFPVIRTPHAETSSSGRPVLGDDVQVLVTPEGFTLLDHALERLREDIIRPEDMPGPPNS